MVRLLPSFLSLVFLSPLSGCGGGAANSGADDPVADGPQVADDPARARAFQGPLDLFVRDLDRAIADAAGGYGPSDTQGVQGVQGTFAFADPEALGDQGLEGGQRIEVGELAFVVRVVKDRGPPESERWEQTTLEATAVRAGGVFRFTRLHSEKRLLASAPAPLAEAGPGLVGYHEFRDALLDGFAGPNCRFLPRLTAGDMRGLYEEDRITAAEEGMADQARIDRLCADWWDRSPAWRQLEVTGLTFYRVARDRKVLSTYDTSLTVRDGAVLVGPVNFQP